MIRFIVKLNIGTCGSNRTFMINISDVAIPRALSILLILGFSPSWETDCLYFGANQVRGYRKKLAFRKKEKKRHSRKVNSETFFRLLNNKNNKVFLSKTVGQIYSFPWKFDVAKTSRQALEASILGLIFVLNLCGQLSADSPTKHYIGELGSRPCQ